MTLSVAPSLPVIEKAMSLLVDRDADAEIVPVTRTRRPSLASPIAPASSTDGAGSTPVPIGVTPPVEARSSTWPYGSASAPRTSSLVPRSGCGDAVGEADGEPAGVIGDHEDRRRPEAPGLRDDHAADRHGRADRAQAARRRCSVCGALDDAVGVAVGEGVAVGVGSGVEVGDAEAGLAVRSGSAWASVVGVAKRSASAPESASAWEPASESGVAVGLGVGVGVGDGRGVGVAVGVGVGEATRRASATARRSASPMARVRHARFWATGAPFSDEVRHVVVRVDRVAAGAAGPTLDRAPGRRRRRPRSPPRTRSSRRPTRPRRSPGRRWAAPPARRPSPRTRRSTSRRRRHRRCRSSSRSADADPARAASVAGQVALRVTVPPVLVT